MDATGPRDLHLEDGVKKPATADFACMGPIDADRAGARLSELTLARVARATADALAMSSFAAFIAWTQANLGEVRVDYSPRSYVGIRRDRPVWAPLWFHRDGATIYLPDPDGLRGEQQSPAMDEFQEHLRREGLETSWQPTYNAGANRVPIQLRQADLASPSPWYRNFYAQPSRSSTPGPHHGQNDTRSVDSLLLRPLELRRAA